MEWCCGEWHFPLILSCFVVLRECLLTLYRDKVFYEVAKEYEGVVDYDKMLVDAMTVRMVNRPESMDTIVATNCRSWVSRCTCKAG
jgi:hypothetical protein